MVCSRVGIAFLYFLLGSLWLSTFFNERTSAFWIRKVTYAWPWALVWILAMGLPLIILERRYPRYLNSSSENWKEVKEHLMLLLISLVFTSVSVQVFYGLIRKLGFSPIVEIKNIPVFFQFICILVVSDFIGYWVHRLLHTKLFWPIHRVHHGSNRLRWHVGFRFHPLDDFTNRIVQMPFFILFGFSEMPLLYSLLYSQLNNFIVHSSWNVHYGPVGKVLVSPRFHHWHHSSDEKTFNRNFSGLFVIWDHLFKTAYIAADDQAPSEFGVK